MDFKALYLSFDGRIGRQTFWLKGVLPLFVINLVISLVSQYLSSEVDPIAGLIVSLPSLVLIWPNLAIAVKRWHDRNKSGWWVLIGLIPLVGPIWALVETGFLEGTPGPNQFGEVTN